MYLQNKGFRYIERWSSRSSSPSAVASSPKSFFPTRAWLPCWAAFADATNSHKTPKMLYIAIGILGATVMPHNLYLHSSIVQTRKYEQTRERQTRSRQVRHAGFNHRIDVRALHQRRHLIVSAASFHGSGEKVEEIQDAYKLLSPVLA